MTVPPTIIASQAYRDRHCTLQSIGYPDYLSYLRGDLWAAIKRRVLKEVGDRCKSCHTEATEVHHRNYSEATLRGHTLDGLVPLCRACHLHVEFYRNGMKVPTLEIANSRLSDLLKKHFDSVDRPMQKRLKEVHEDLVKIQAAVNALYAKLKKSKHGGAITGLRGQVANTIDRLMKN